MPSGFYELALRLDQTKCISFSLVYDIDLVCLCIAEYEEIVSGQFHLHTCILRIHWLHTKSLGTHDLDLLILICITVNKCLAEIFCYIHLLGRKFGTIFSKLTLDNLLNQVDRYIHIIAALL